ncbi:hypothetical protein HPP92_017495 [Vanilla planifolia]|uniref:Uncharacterized protein n=1 Tax=Vanilla planifolia TaxID=51239 RepID=A0A835QFJ3_VANPL|nr:hypothetical protein HPP92_017495 [Vanilla planifolia]
MSTQKLLTSLLLFSFLSSFAYTQPSTSSESYGKLKDSVVVEGMVYCQNCNHAGSWSLDGAKPLAAARVGISCRDHKGRPQFYKVFQADGNGYYYAPIQGEQGEESYRKEKKIGACRIHLLSSPDDNCNLLTNINMGIAGAAVGKEKKVLKREGYDVIVHAAPPLAFRSANCSPGVSY